MAAVLVVLLAIGPGRVGAADGENGPANATAVAAQGGACAGLSDGDHAVDVDAGGGPRSILIHVPAAGSASARPLVLALAGAGQTPRDFQHLTNYSALADQQGFVVVYAGGTGSSPFWNMSGALPGKPDDVAFLSAVLDRVEALTCVDATRVYATGVSNGGGMTALLGCRLAGRLAAIAPVAGGYGTQPACRPARPAGAAGGPRRRRRRRAVRREGRRPHRQRARVPGDVASYRRLQRRRTAARADARRRHRDDLGRLQRGRGRRARRARRGAAQLAALVTGAPVLDDLADLDVLPRARPHTARYGLSR